MLAASETFLVEAARGEMARCWPKPSPAAVCDAVDAVFRLAEATWGARRSSLKYMLEAPAAACKAGCGWCCHQQVGLSAPEAIRIAAHIQALPAEEGEAMTARVRQVAERTAGMDTGDWAGARIACPFLGADGNCMIYAVRPLRCRGVHSIDVEFCIGCYEDLEAMRAKMEAGDLEPVFLDMPVRIFDSALAGILSALRKLAPKAVVSLEMSATVAALLDQPRLAERWLAGARPDKSLNLKGRGPL